LLIVFNRYANLGAIGKIKTARLSVSGFFRIHTVFASAELTAVTKG
jgi:hypothetical protein